MESQSSETPLPEDALEQVSGGGDVMAWDNVKNVSWSGGETQRAHTGKVLQDIEIDKEVDR